MLIKILNWRTHNVIFKLDKENNTIKDTVEEAVRQGISLRGAYILDKNLEGADLRNADLCFVDLRYANLSGADLTGADLSGANLSHSVLSGADLRSTNINNAHFNECILDNTIMPDLPMVCPETGSFIGYKKISATRECCFDRQFIVKLEIPEDAKRSSATTNKCRCSKAKVLEIKDIKSGETIDEITNTNLTFCVYKVGEMVYPDTFDECRWHECSNGIHFFMTEKEALEY